MLYIPSDITYKIYYSQENLRNNPILYLYSDTGVEIFNSIMSKSLNIDSLYSTTINPMSSGYYVCYIIDDIGNLYKTIIKIGETSDEYVFYSHNILQPSTIPYNIWNRNEVLYMTGTMVHIKDNIYRTDNISLAPNNYFIKIDDHPVIGAVTPSITINLSPIAQFFLFDFDLDTHTYIFENNSYDLDGSIVHQVWNVEQKQDDGSWLLLTDTDDYRLTQIMDEGFYKIKLSVWDNKGRMSSVYEVYNIFYNNDGSGGIGETIPTPVEKCNTPPKYFIFENKNITAQINTNKFIINMDENI